MKEMIDLYAKLVIGTFSFIGPSFTLLISLFFNGIRKSREKHEAQLETLQRLIQSKFANGANFENNLNVGRMLFRAKTRANKRELNLLNPKRQVRRLFGSLIIAILLIGCYYFQHSNFCPFNSGIIRILTILLSGVSFLFSLNVLWQIFCTIIRIKSEEDEVKQTQNVPLRTKGGKPFKD